VSKKNTETEFQIRIDNVDRTKVFDFTEKKLLVLSRTMPTKAERDACAALLGMYLSGTVAVKWFSGSPRYVKVPSR
jgi:hypothetical protein